jgi:hypothetical protein
MGWSRNAKNIMNGGKDEEFSATNEEISFEFSIHEYCTYAGGYTGSAASFESPFDLTHI